VPQCFDSQLIHHVLMIVVSSGRGLGRRRSNCQDQHQSTNSSANPARHLKG
jgi:hypothetical protein